MHVQRDVGTDIRGSRAKQPCKDSLALLQVQGISSEGANALKIVATAAGVQQ